MVRFSDKIAYLHHDMDDAQRAGIITEDDIPVTMRMLLGYTTRERLNTLYMTYRKQYGQRPDPDVRGDTGSAYGSQGADVPERL